VLSRTQSRQPPSFSQPTVDGSAGDGDDGGSERREDVVAVVPVARDVAPKGAVGVDVVGGAGDGEHEVTLSERRCHGQRLAGRAPGLLPSASRGDARALLRVSHRGGLRHAQGSGPKQQRRPRRQISMGLYEVDREGGDRFASTLQLNRRL
jgi:hypothetical protein